ALLFAAAGRWEEARLDLRACRRRLPGGALPTAVAPYGTWVSLADTPSTRYLDATSEVLGYLPVPLDLRIRLSEEVLRRLEDAATARKDGLNDDEAKAMTAWTHVRLAGAFAAKNDPQGVLKQIRSALDLKRPDVTPKTFRDDPTFSAWN